MLSNCFYLGPPRAFAAPDEWTRPESAGSATDGSIGENTSVDENRSVDEITLTDSVEWETNKFISLPPIEEVPDPASRN